MLFSLASELLSLKLFQNRVFVSDPGSASLHSRSPGDPAIACSGVVLSQLECFNLGVARYDLLRLISRGRQVRPLPILPETP